MKNFEIHSDDRRINDDDQRINGTNHRIDGNNQRFDGKNQRIDGNTIDDDDMADVTNHADNGFQFFPKDW